MTADEDAVSLGTVWQVYRVPIVLGCVSFLFILLSITIFIKSYQNVQPIRFSSDEERASVSGTMVSDRAVVYVDVEGAVIHPGVYALPSGSRVEDALILAGGLSAQADTGALARSINRAAKLSDGAKIFIPEKGDASGVVAGVGGTGAPGMVKVNINTALPAELEGLPGVGSVTAGKIIGGRPYLRLEELVEKKVFGQSLFSRLKDQLTL